MLRLLKGLDLAVARLEQGLLLLLVVLLVLLSVAQVVARQAMPHWLPIFLKHEVLWIGLLGASLATREGGHITVDVLARFLRPAAARRLEILSGLGAYAGCLFLAWAAWGYQAEKWAADRAIFRVEWLSLEVGEAAAVIVLPVALTVMCARFALAVWERVLREPEAGA